MRSSRLNKSANMLGESLQEPSSRQRSRKNSSAFNSPRPKEKVPQQEVPAKKTKEKDNTPTELKRLANKDEKVINKNDLKDLNMSIAQRRAKRERDERHSFNQFLTIETGKAKT